MMGLLSSTVDGVWDRRWKKGYVGANAQVVVAVVENGVPLSSWGWLTVWTR